MPVSVTRSRSLAAACGEMRPNAKPIPAVSSGRDPMGPLEGETGIERELIRLRIVGAADARRKSLLRSPPLPSARQHLVDHPIDGEVAGMLQRIGARCSKQATLRVKALIGE